MVTYSSGSSPFMANGLTHRGRSFTVEELRKLKQNVYVLTDLEELNETELVDQTDGLLGSLAGLSDDEISQSAFYVHFSTDEAANSFISRIIHCGGAFVPPMVFSKPPYSRVARHVSASMAESESRLGFLFGPREVHENICQAVDLTKEVEGDLLEVGVYSGSSALTAMTHMRNIGIRRKCWLIDTFEGFSYAEAHASADVIWRDTHEMCAEAQRAKLTQLLASCGQEVEFITANICSDALPTAIASLAIVNLDVDLYEATVSALRKIAPLVQRRGVIICEDPASTPGCYGAMVAMNEFLTSEVGKHFVKVFVGSQFFLLRADA
jgi:hypothetical protein